MDWRTEDFSCRPPLRSVLNLAYVRWMSSRKLLLNPAPSPPLKASLLLAVVAVFLEGDASLPPSLILARPPPPPSRLEGLSPFVTVTLVLLSCVNPCDACLCRALSIPSRRRALTVLALPPEWMLPSSGPPVLSLISLITLWASSLTIPVKGMLSMSSSSDRLTLLKVPFDVSFLCRLVLVLLFLYLLGLPPPMDDTTFESLIYGTKVLLLPRSPRLGLPGPPMASRTLSSRKFQLTLELWLVAPVSFVVTVTRSKLNSDTSEMYPLVLAEEGAPECWPPPGDEPREEWPDGDDESEEVW
mmetsp:Transcript_28495/g.60383  ORF Transcript_28495/g.60383 Transcript_28495/m.60383 type:complete len:300 (-) Transcript_28495:435-1334(-)